MDQPAPDAVMKVARALIEGGFAPGAEEGQPETPAFYRVREIAALLNVDDSTVYRWIERGVLHAHRFEDTIRVSAADFEAYKHRCLIRPVRSIGRAAPGAVA